jgi:hypothetical protein
MPCLNRILGRLLLALLLVGTSPYAAAGDASVQEPPAHGGHGVDTPLGHRPATSCDHCDPDGPCHKFCAPVAVTGREAAVSLPMAYRRGPADPGVTADSLALAPDPRPPRPLVA